MIIPAAADKPEPAQKTAQAFKDKIAQYEHGIGSGTWSKRFCIHARKQIKKLRDELAEFEKKETK